MNGAGLALGGAGDRGQLKRAISHKVLPNEGRCILTVRCVNRLARFGGNSTRREKRLLPGKQAGRKKIPAREQRAGILFHCNYSPIPEN